MNNYLKYATTDTSSFLDVVKILIATLSHTVLKLVNALHNIVSRKGETRGLLHPHLAPKLLFLKPSNPYTYMKNKRAQMNI